jgi:hypothetical protein
VWTPGSCLVFAPEPPMLLGLQPRSSYPSSPTSIMNHNSSNNSSSRSSNVLTDKSKADMENNANPLMRMFAPTSCFSLALPTLPGLEDDDE